MTQPLPAPTFGSGYTTPPMDIGSGYAAGIASAGKSLAGAISSLMGSVNPETGQVQEGILQQGASAHQMIDILHGAGIIGPDEYETLKTSNLGAQQKAIGMYAGMLTARYQNQLEMQKQAAAEQAAMARTQVGETGATQRSQATIAAEAQRQKEQLELERQRILIQQQQDPNRFVVRPRTSAAPPVGAPNTVVPPPAIVNKPFGLNINP